MNNIKNQDFISNRNIEMLWELILDNNNIKQLLSTDRSIINKLRKHYINEAKTFVDNNNISNKLVDANKLFISTFMNTLISKNSYKKLDLSKLTPIDNNTITIEELHASRLHNFEKKLQEKQDDFNNAITKSVPESPNFSDNLDIPIPNRNIQDLVNKAIEDRKLEYEITPNNNIIKGRNNNNSNSNIISNTSNNINEDHELEYKGEKNNEKQLSWDPKVEYIQSEVNHHKPSINNNSSKSQENNEVLMNILYKITTIEQDIRLIKNKLDI